MTEETLYNERQLLVSTGDGDETAFRRLYDHYRRKTYLYALHILESSALSDEVVQEVFLKVWVNRKKLPEVDSFEAWLQAIVKNHVFDLLKKISREALAMKEFGAAFNQESDATEAALLNKENEQLLQEAIEKLTPQQRQIYALCRFEGLKHDEVAAKLNISPNTVKVHMTNAHRIIRSFLHPLLNPGSVLLLFALFRNFK